MDRRRRADRSVDDSKAAERLIDFVARILIWRHALTIQDKSLEIPGFWAKVRHAFAIDPASEVISAEEEGLLSKVATGVVKRQLEVPASMFLESVRPLNFLASQALVFLQPILGMVLSPAEVEKFAKLLEKRNALPRLIELIEDGAAKR